MSESLTRALVADVLDKHHDDLIDLRRDLHAHPELSWAETRTSRLVSERLVGTGWRITQVEGGGVVADIGEGGGLIALRGDMDALPIEDLTPDPWRSTVDGVAHACGHDVHTTALLGAGLALAEVAERGLLTGRVRLVFQPAEEVMPGGALHMLARGQLEGVDQLFGLHCDPSLDVGEVGVRTGPLTGAADMLTVRLHGHGGHTSRPHLTEDLTFALGKLVTELPAILSRRLDPRAGASLVWGMVSAGSAANVIPHEGVASGTVRMLDAVAWGEAEALVRSLVDVIVGPYGVSADIDYQRGVPPVVNGPIPARVLGEAVSRSLGPQGVVPTPQSLGGEDFGWYLDRIPGAMGRLGTRTPGGETFDLHQGNLRVDERAIAVGARVLAHCALVGLSGANEPGIY